MTHLTFFNDFDLPLAAGVLPAGLTHLKFGEWFDHGQPLAAGVLPAGLMNLTFGSAYNQPLAAGVRSNRGPWVLHNSWYVYFIIIAPRRGSQI